MKLTPRQALIVELGLMSKALDILLKKRSDYSGDEDPFRNLRSAEVWGVDGWRGTGVRMQDKFSRTRAIMDKGGVAAVKGEKLIDDWADVYNYVAILAGLCIELIDNEFPNQGDMMKEIEQEADKLWTRVDGMIGRLEAMDE